MLFLGGCVENSAKYRRLVAQVDSLSAVSAGQNQELESIYADINDVTAGMQSLREAEHLLLLEAEKETMRANLLRAVSHDLRTPLTGIIGACSTFLDARDSLTAKEQTELVKNINDDANWLLNMVENLLAVTRIHDRSSSVRKTDESVEEIVSAAIMRLKKRLPEAAFRNCRYLFDNFFP